jgi:hypothetical protein
MVRVTRRRSKYDIKAADKEVRRYRLRKSNRRRFNVEESMRRGSRGPQRWLSKDIAIADRSGKIIGVVSGKNRFMKNHPPAPTTKRLHKSDREDDSIIGFGLSKVFDKRSIFCGLPSLNTITSYVELVVDHSHLIPSTKDSPWVARAKWAGLIWKVMRNVSVRSGKVLDRADLKQIDF